jgi:NAD(P)-dependent dehydrogenase (short-subunit alcohol dehydrogenase family)
MSRFAGRIAAVTGAASGLGAAIAERLAAEGAHVILADVDDAGLARTAGVIRAAGGRAQSVRADVTHPADVEAMVRAAADAGGLHVLVLSAAVETRAGLAETSDADWQRVLDVDLKGPFLCMRAGIPLMVRSGGGAVVALGSTLGAIGQPGYAAYCAAKGALVNLCKQAAVEHAADGVRVNVVSPSACDVGLFARVAEATGKGDELRGIVAANVPMRRLGTAADVCDAVCFLASAAAAYISAAVLPLDGGLAARRM